MFPGGRGGLKEVVWTSVKVSLDAPEGGGVRSEAVRTSVKVSLCVPPGMLPSGGS